MTETKTKLLRVLAIDPGYANLGIAILDMQRGTKGVNSVRKVVFSDTLRVGDAAHPLLFARKLIPHLNKLDEEYGPFDVIGMEGPTFIMRRVMVTALIWHVIGVLTGWAEARKIPIRHRTPIQLKKAACFLLEKKFDQKNIPKKSDIRKAIDKLGHHPRRTNHENDAILAAFACFGI